MKKIKDFYGEKTKNGRNEMNSNAPEMQEKAEAEAEETLETISTLG